MSDPQRPLPPKKDVALALLEREPSVFIHLDPRRSGVSVPKWFTGQAQLVLQIGMNMAIPILDLKVDDDGISCTLSFSRTPFWCRIPWSAIWALVTEDHRGMVWPDDIPPDLAVQGQRQKGAAPQKPAKKPRPRLAAVGSPAAGRDEGRADEDGAPAAGGDDDRGSPTEPAVEPAAEPAAVAGARPGPARPSSRPPAGDADAQPAGAKPKRELPPYLRVIK